VRIVIDLQGIQPANIFWNRGRSFISLIQALIKNRNNHEILLALTDLYPDTIELVRASFENLLPSDAITVWHAPRLPDKKEQEEWIHNTAFIIRNALISGLNPDIVHLVGWHEMHGQRHDGHETAKVPFSLSIVEPKVESEGVCQAALLFTDESVHRKIVKSLPCMTPDRLVQLPLGNLNGTTSGISGSESQWNHAALLAISAWECMMNQTGAAIPAVTASHRPRLAYVSPLPPERSGISDYSAELLPELIRHYDIDLIIDQTQVSLPSTLSHCPVRSVGWLKANADLYDRIVYHFGNSPFHKHMFDLLDEVPGIVVLHDFFLSGIVEHLETRGSSPGSWAAELYNAHGYRALRHYLQVHDKEFIVRSYPCNYRVLHAAEGVIVHSAYAKELAARWYGHHAAHHWRVIPHLRVPPAPEKQRAEARRLLGIAENQFLVCSFGHMGPLKLNHRLFDAWLASSLAGDSECLLVFVGENDGGPYGNQLNESIQKHRRGSQIRISGWASMDTFREYLAAADVGVQLRTHSRGETSGAVLDCMNYGLPTIVNANGSMAELPGESVIMLPDDFSDAELAAALEKLRHDPDFRLRLGSSAKAHIRQHHNPETITRLYVDAIETFARGPEIHRSRAIDTIAKIPGLPENNEHLTEIARAVAASMPSRCRQQQVLIDVSALVQEDLKTGIQRVVRSIVKNLIDHPPGAARIEPVFATKEKSYRYARQFTLRSLGCHATGFGDDPVDIHQGDILFIPDLHVQIIDRQKTYLQQLRRIGVRVIFLVHDILPVRYPEFFPDGTFGDFQKWLGTVAQSDGAICVTRTVADDLYNWIETNKPERHRPFLIGWNHHGADIEASIPSKGFPVDFPKIISKLSGSPTVLMVGTVEPRKGHALALQAMEKLWKEGSQINLVIVGKHGWMVDDLANRIKKHKESGKKLFWFQGISDEALLKLYETASGVLMASEGEGFGLPLIEAAQHGVPVLARNIPVFREIGRDNIQYFNEGTPAAVAASIDEWIRQISERTVPDSRNMPWKTWRQSTETLAEMLIDPLHHNWIYGKNNSQ